MLELEAAPTHAQRHSLDTEEAWDPIRRESSTAHVLVIEDHAGLNQALGIRLRASGLRVSSAFDGPDGLDQAVCLEPDLIVLDLGLPRLSGSRVLERLRSHVVTSNIPIVIVTGRRDIEIFDHLLGWDSIHRVFYKPTPTARIACVVGEILEDRQR